LVGEKEESDMI